MRKCLIGLGLMIVFASPTVVFSGGYEFGGLGAKAVGMSGAFIGLADDWTAIYWNPAGLAQLEGRGAGSYLEYAIVRGRDENSVANEVIYPTEPSKFTKEKIETEAILPSFGYWQKFQGFTLGGGIYTPNGNAIDWNDRAKDATGADIKASYHTLLFISVGNVSLAKEITDNLSVGAGLNLVYGKFELEAKKSYSSTMPDTFPDYNLANKMEGDGTGLEGVVGFLFRPSAKISIGGIVRSGSLLELEGEGKGSLNLLAVSEESDYTQRFAYPATCGLGMSYRATPKLTLTCDWARTYWNSMEEDIDFDNDTGTEDAHSTVLLQDKNESLDWSNTDRFRIGLEYRPNQAWSLRVGFFTDPSPVPAKGVDITKLIDVDCKFITLGAGYKRERWQLDLSYAHSSGEETLNGVKYTEDGDAVSLTGIYRF